MKYEWSGEIQMGNSTKLMSWEAEIVQQSKKDDKNSLWWQYSKRE